MHLIAQFLILRGIVQVYHLGAGVVQQHAKAVVQRVTVQHHQGLAKVWYQRYAAGVLLFGSQQQGVHIFHSLDACRIDAQLVQNIGACLKADGHRRWIIARHGNQLAIVPHAVPAVLAHSFFQRWELFQPIIQRFGSAIRG